ncbi:DNA-invertase hin [Streptomyces lavendulae subsp. lavendulae]|uniref:DNA-invertase hin n=1 Tax=Streptomyces lavendulae subsp. lavendulae TaxID=58340 RepID=A0A2K8PJB2_STRLA|nr:recombinase family protein [Streptomyces lavendulae]ATZ26832.1 DNA-invertase hin [Streptomyces lavendulae subsp. lavendulae]
MTTPKPSANIKRHVTRSGADVTAHTNPAPVRPELAFSLRLSISSDESSSLAVQRRACRAQAVALGLDPDTAVEYIDEDVSGASALESRTEGMARILVDRPRVVIAWKLDRFARSVSEFLKLVTWSEEHGVALATADGALNTSTPGGRLVATILAALAQWEREMIQDRVTAAHAERREQGRWIAGRAPFPYVMERRDGKAYLAEDPKAFALVRAQIEALLAGGKNGTLSATAEALPIGRIHWRNLLRGVVLRGWREHKGELVTESDGVTPVQFGPEVIDAATYKRVKDRLRELEAGERAPRRNAPWLADMVFCADGCKMNGGMNDYKRSLYKCSKGHGSIMAHFLEPEVFTTFRAEHGDQPLYEVTYSGGIDHSGEIADLDAQRGRITKAVAQVDGPALETLTAKLTELEATYARLKAEHAPDVTETWTLTDKKLWEAWDEATEDQRRNMLANEGCRITVHPKDHPGGRIVIEWNAVPLDPEGGDYATAA